ncbi:DUF2267 domain-containing protein [Candidatus Cyanaurora vandensis]|uniref:DUF2267 domain-containing protein n=1 Tax=Candidatus Cyanaurora vandensis TaxID=2714958 RepID=UPI002579AB48|nr:DUF2267 domain-containing protein [Candidatus Cyanaurora vandensis]
MKYDEFLAQVRRRADLDHQEAVYAVQAVLETLSEHMAGREPHNLASQLPLEISQYLHHDPGERAEARGERFSLTEFYGRVRDREQVDLEKAQHHAQIVIEVLTEAVTEGLMRGVRAQFPAEYEALFKAPVR